MSALTRVRGSHRPKWVSGTIGRVGFRRWALAVVTFASLFVIMAFDLMPSTVDIKAGQVAKRDIEAPRTIVNKPRTEALQRDARRRALQDAVADMANYEIDQTVALRAEGTLNSLFTLTSSKRGAIRRTEKPALQAAETQAVRDSAVELRLQVKRYQSLDLLPRTALTLLTSDEVTYAALRAGTLEIATEVLRDNRIQDTAVSTFRDFSVRQVDGLGLSAVAAAAVRDIVAAMVRPNLVLSATRARRLEDSAVRSVEQVMVLKGQAIVRRGEVVSAEEEALLGDLGLRSKGGNYGGLLGVAALLGVILVVGVLYLRLYNREILAREEHMALLAMLLVVTAFLAKLLTSLEYPKMGYLIPVPFAAMLVAVLLDSRLAIVFAAACATLVGVLTDFELRYATVSMVGSLVGVLALSEVHQRSDLTRAGFWTGVGGFCAASSLGLLSGDFPLATLASGGLAATSGVISAILTIGCLPFIETFFGIASSLKLVELSNPTQVLLKRLLVEAPGTYHHSIIVGNLAEAACEAIGADYVLARVGAHYHDIGKLKRPYFFVENQFAAENPHDKISPSLSTVIITSHVRDGEALAEERNLPEVVVDFIRQHHGTSLVTFFYHRAAENAGGEEVSEAQYRYSGPRPQTRETGVVMLADSVEAAVRSMPQPTPHKIEQLIRRIVRERLIDGQLDECDLTLRELATITDVFLKVLSGIFHSRVEYPEIAPSAGQTPAAHA